VAHFNLALLLAYLGSFTLPEIQCSLRVAFWLF